MSTVEFVIIFPIALLVVLCLVQCGVLYMGKLTLTHATFMAARHGASVHANEAAMRAVLVKGLIPLYQDASLTDDATRISQAHARAVADTSPPQSFLSVVRLSPNTRTFQDFGVHINGQWQIPNDNLRWRSTEVRANSGVNVQDANLLKIKATYGLALKVPLMASLLRATMCGGNMPLRRWWGPGDPTAPGPQGDCNRYYAAGRVPIEAFAVVEMHSPAYP